jgi:4-hydroxy-tetrahydrodipicolinate reductase
MNSSLSLLLALALLLVSYPQQSTSFTVMVNGMPGPMATAAAEACLRKGLTLTPIGLTGPDVPPQNFVVTDPDTKRSQTIRLLPVSNRECIDVELGKIHSVNGDVIAIDYTHPSSVNENGDWYVQKRIPFVMGTTGGDRERLRKSVAADPGAGKEEHYSVIAPNMGKQIVAIQHALEKLSDDFPGSFKGYDLEVVESHQKTKADTSGTAIAVINSIKGLIGSPIKGKREFEVSDVKMLRDEASSSAFGVPKEAIDGGHAFHTYTITSPDKTVQFELKHNVCGRRVYAEGTADAVKFLDVMIRRYGPEKGKCFDMIDVLKEGALE